MSLSFSSHTPSSLEELFAAFAFLEQGRSVAMFPNLDRRGKASEISDIAPPEREPSLGVCSSGSTGQPKLIWKSWSDLKRAARVEDRVRGWTWCSAFDPWSFAGAQVALHAWLARGRAVSLSRDWPENWRLLNSLRAEVLSATPTFLDLLLQWEGSAECNAAAWHPRQITLGGEIVRPSLAARAVQRFPETRFTCIYATAELGVLATTHRTDGWYELDSLERHCDEWRVREGLLQVRVQEDWKSTGDGVKISNRRFCVTGRQDEIANVAGAKVNLVEIGLLAETVPGVRRAVAFAEASPVVGQIVSLRYEMTEGADAVEVESCLQTELRQRLRKEAWPRRWVAGEVGLGNNSKQVRR